MAQTKGVISAPKMDDEYQIGYDADTLTKAAEIMADKPRFAKAKAHYQKRQDRLDKLTSGLRRKA